MRRILTLLFLSINLIANILNAEPTDYTPLSFAPVLYEGRYLPMDVYVKKILTDNNFVTSKEPLQQAILLHLGKATSPNISIQDETVKNLLGTDDGIISYDSLVEALFDSSETNLRFVEPIIVTSFWEAYNQQGKRKITLSNLHPNLKVQLDKNTITLTEVPNQKPWHQLKKGQSFATFPEQKNIYKKLKDNSLSLLQTIAFIEKHRSPDPYLKDLQTLQSQNISPETINATLNQNHPLYIRLSMVAPSFQMLPDKSKPERWYPLKSIGLKVYDPSSNTIKPISNFTAFSDEDFQEIQSSYENFQNSLHGADAKILSDKLQLAYQKIADAPYGETSKGALYFPSSLKLKVESYYSSIPWTLTLIICYIIATLALTLPLNKWSYVPLAAAFTLHTAALLIRSYILSRPPVSNMTETVLFVPWVAIVTGIILSLSYRSKIPLACASASAAILFTVLKLSGNNESLENVQAVLNSQFWLTIHVLMVVGSYGAFLLSGFLGHIYLLYQNKNAPNRSTNALLSKLVLQSMYLGLALLIPGTILGGVWAAQSWGRFWDWDPKESWAFISCCTYLIIVHAHYFGLIRQYGVAVGSVVGLMVIAFTWYGVNYILGTGMHSYGFGNGGEHLFYLYLSLEAIFLAINSAVRYAKRPSGEPRTP